MNRETAGRTTWSALAALAMLALEIQGCAGSDETPCPDGPQLELTETQRQRYAEVSECTQLQAPEPVVQYGPVGPCPTSGRMCCLADEPAFRCPDGEDRNGDGQADRCGTAGRYYGACGMVRLPDAPAPDCGQPFGHEAIHHLLHENTGDVDAGHKRDEWYCQ